MAYINIALLIIIVFVCVYAIVSRICQSKEKKYESELVMKMYKEWLETKHPMDDILNKIKRSE